MPIPNTNEIKAALLDLLKAQNEIRIRDAYLTLKNHFQLSDEEYNQLYPSGSDYIFKNRVRWARQQLIDDKYAISPKTGYLRLSDNYEPHAEIPIQEENDIIDPIENIETNYQVVNNIVKRELLSMVKNSSWQFFEQLVIDLLLKMGYGSSKADASRAFQTTNDEGIDGVINEDTLGLEKIYVQAKKWENNVSRPDLQKFVGALAGRRSHKGVFITTSDFSSPAADYINSLNEQVVLINGDRLTGLMLENKLGINVVKTYEISRIDQDYFENE